MEGANVEKLSASAMKKVAEWKKNVPITHEWYRLSTDNRSPTPNNPLTLFFKISKTLTAPDVHLNI